MKIEKVSYLNDIYKLNSEGLVLCGTGGDLQEWVTGVTDYLYEEKAISSKVPEEVWAKVMVFDTVLVKPKRTDMLMLFLENSENVNIGRLAIVRLKMNNEITRTSWLSDYVVNFDKDFR